MEKIDKPVTETEKKRERLLYVVASGQSKLFFGKGFTIEEVEKWDEKAVDKAFKIYEARYSSLLSDSVTKSFIDMGACAIGKVVPIDNQVDYTTDLKKDFILNSELKKVTGRIAYTWGPLLALISTSLITGKHLDFDYKKLYNIFNGGERADAKADGGGDADAKGDAKADGVGYAENYFTEKTETPRQSSCGEEAGRMEQREQTEEAGTTGNDSDGGADADNTLVQ